MDFLSSRVSSALAVQAIFAANCRGHWDGGSGYGRDVAASRQEPIQNLHRLHIVRIGRFARTVYLCISIMYSSIAYLANKLLAVAKAPCHAESFDEVKEAQNERGTGRSIHE